MLNFLSKNPNITNNTIKTFLLANKSYNGAGANINQKGALLKDLYKTFCIIPDEPTAQNGRKDAKKRINGINNNKSLDFKPLISSAKKSQIGNKKKTCLIVIDKPKISEATKTFFILSLRLANTWIATNPRKMAKLSNWR
jgi:hypothetical protein